MIAAAANEVLRTYPDQMIAVEGHTDNDPVVGGQLRSNRELSFARAMVVYDVLITRTACPTTNSRSSATARTVPSSRTPPTKANSATAAWNWWSIPTAAGKMR